MNELRDQIARARRRLVTEQFLARLVWCLSATLGVAAVAIAIPRIAYLRDALLPHTLPQDWDLRWFASALVAGLAAAALWTLASRRSALDAAIEIDRRFDLRERIASSISLSPAELDTDAGQALVKDAVRAAARIDVNEKFRPQLTDRAWLPLVPAAIAFLLIAVFNPSPATSSPDPASPAVVAQQIKTANEALRKKLAAQREQAKRDDLKVAEGLFKKIEAGTRDLTEKKDLDRTKAAVKMNDLAKQLDQRRKELGGKDALQKQLQNLKQFGGGAGEKIAKAMKQGDFKQAAEQLEKLAREIKEGKLDEQAKAELAKQLEQMKKQLADAADAHSQAMQNLKKEIEQARKNGDMGKAGDLQQKLDQLASQSPQMQQLEQLAQQMEQMQQGMKEGDSQKASEALQQMAQQLSEMQKEANEAEMLDAAMEELQAAKDAMACKNCQGGGCKECNGGLQLNMLGMKDSDSNRPQSGIGKGRGNGRPPKDEPKTSSRETQVRVQPGRGPAIYAGTAKGPNIKGEVSANIQQEMAGLGTQEADPLTTERLPRNRREHAEQYFNLLRDGKE